ncbi:RDD family protein [Nonlabens sp. SY33080]|uniref:RDD family protein n=1 Tax=Nonlabens sp. SY33080 TaxID=2719911 RepID=UPI001428A0EB|nr:RDD family protein [Nonlabens sp. SY33080]
MSNTAINTAQNVNIEYVYAGLGKRILAFIIDALVLFAYIIILTFTVYRAISVLDGDNDIGAYELSMIPIFIYSVIMHIIFNGRTVGKFIMGIKVVKEDGSPARWSDFIVRWIVRLVDLWLFMFTVGTVSILLTDKQQRLGDMMAKTIVINTRKSVNISHTILQEVDEGYQPIFHNAHLLSDIQANEIKEIYRLAGQSRDYNVLHQLRLKIESILQIKSDLKDGQFVRTVLKDYFHLTSK